MQAKSIFITLLIAGGILTGCGESSDTTDSTTDDNLSVRLQLPDSLTGGTTNNSPASIASKIANVALANRSNTGEPCSFIGHEDKDDPFRNGYETSRFLISTMATWTCLADLLIDLAALIDHDGSIIESDNDTLAPDYEADDPTHYSITDISDTQVMVNMYYGFSRAVPPLPTDPSQFYISWNEASEDIVEGKIIVDIGAIDQQQDNEEEPSMMRMDFDFDQNQRSADMFLQFGEDNNWADGFRVQISKDLNASPLGQVYTARGLIEMTGQFFPVAGISETPHIQLYTVADLLGNGATIQEVQNFSLPLLINFFLNNHLGDYLLSKHDVYFFEADQDWEYINKAINFSEYRGSRNTPATGGSWIPFDPSLDMIKTALSLPADYFSNSQCENIGDDCNDFLNAVFVDGFSDQEKNQGTDPLDWRSTALDNADYLTSIFPNGINWDGAFDQTFTPSL